VGFEAAVVRPELLLMVAWAGLGSRKRIKGLLG
jgi:hypothetical protein